jgi:hypothetical protein
LARKAAALMNGRVYRSPDAPNEIVVINEIANRRRAEAFVKSENQRPGVVAGESHMS